jgi:hypothetical protein
MSRNVLFVLLLVTGVALADKKPEAKHAIGPNAAQKKTAEVRGNTEKAKAEVEEPQGRSEKSETEEPSEPGAQAQTDKDGTVISVPGGKALGMSVLGNQEAPTSLVIVPWKTSEVGRSPGISPMLDDSRQPIDKEVFMRALSYYQIRSETKP